LVASYDWHFKYSFAMATYSSENSWTSVMMGLNFKASNSVSNCMSLATVAFHSYYSWGFSFGSGSSQWKAFIRFDYRLTAGYSCQKSYDYSIVINFKKFASIENFSAVKKEKVESCPIGYCWNWC
jgi:hypothetical protein